MKPTTDEEVEALNKLLDDMRVVVTNFTDAFLRHVERLRSGVLAAALEQNGFRWEGDADEEVSDVPRLADVRRRRGSGDVSRMSRLNHPAGKR